MRYSRNKYLARFGGDGLQPPNKWTSKQAESLFAAGLEAERGGDWINHALGTILVTLEPQRPELSPFGTDLELVGRRVKRHVAKLRADAEIMERTLAAYGPGAFVVEPQAVECPVQPASAEPFLLSILRLPWTRIWIAGAEFVRGASGGAVKKEK